MKTTAIIPGVVLLLMAAAVIWWRYYTRDARAMDSAAAHVTLSDRDTSCEVSDSSYASRQRMQCSEVVSYLQGHLNVQLGSTVGVAALGKVQSERLDAVSAALTKSGYKIAGVMRVGFITEPEPRR